MSCGSSVTVVKCVRVFFDLCDSDSDVSRSSIGGRTFFSVSCNNGRNDFKRASPPDKGEKS